MPRREEILSNMRMYLQSQDPQWDISPGTPEFKILEAVAQQLESVSLDGLLSTYHFDIDKKSGAELDLFLALFGFYRLRAQRATGMVVMTRGSDAPSDMAIPLGTQVLVPAENGSPSIFFATTASAIMSQGTRQIVVPVEATISGTTGNVSAYAISSFGSGVTAVTEVYNPSPTNGGADAESDSSFRERFRRTFMRGMAGTENQFAGVALAEAGVVNKVSVISPVENYNEQIQFYPIPNIASSTPYQVDHVGTFSSDISTQRDNLPNIAEGESFLVVSILNDEFVDFHKFTISGAGFTYDNAPANGSYDKLLIAYESSVRDAKYIFPSDNEIVGTNLGTADEVLAKPNSLDTGLETADYAMITAPLDSAVATFDINYPVFVFSTSGVVRLGGPETVVTAQFEYTPIASRNNPPEIMNKMDLFVEGEEANTISEQVYMVHNLNSIFSSDSSTNLDSTLFIRDDGVTHPKDNNIFTLLGKAPVISLPNTISVNRFIAPALEDRDNPRYNLDESQIYYKDEDYWFVERLNEAPNYDVYAGTRRSIQGIEWNTPLTGRSEQEGADDTYIKPVTTKTNFDAPFSVYQSNYVGKLNGYYAYVITWEASGKESIPSNPKALSAKVSNKQVLFSFSGDSSTLMTGTGANYEVITGFDEASNANYRKIYRSKAAATVTEALQGPFYLVKVIKNNDGNVYWLDNTADDDLGFATPPKPAPPNGAPLSLGYTYNSLIERLDNRLDSVRLVGQDVMTHQAKEIPVKFNLAVVPNLNSSYNSVRTGVTAALKRFLGSKPFGADIQIADVIAAVESASEVDNVRLLKKDDLNNIDETEDEVFEMRILSSLPFTSTDLFYISVDGRSTSALAADEHGYIVREALESLPVIDAGDTYATFLTSALRLAAQDNATTDDTTLQLWDNSNADRISEMVTDGEDVYLQVTQLGNDNLYKDEIIKVIAVGTDNPPAFKTYDILGVTASGSNKTITTAVHGLDVGNDIIVYDNSDNVIGTIFTLTAVTANTVTFADPSNLVPTNLTSYFQFELSEGSKTFTVARGQLGSIKRNYGNGTDSTLDDVLRAGSEAWVHVLGDVAVAKNPSFNGREITYTISMLKNAFTGINNWGSRSLYDSNNKYRFVVNTNGSITANIVRKVAGLGAAIEIMAPNLKTIKTRTDEDIYFASNEVLTFGGLDLVLRARNTFHA